MMSFGTPPPLTATAQILYAVETESQGYKLNKVRVVVRLAHFVHAYAFQRTGELLVLYIHDSGYIDEEFWGTI